MPQPDNTEQRILRAAVEVFLQHGKDGARMQAIAERAGVNKALLHYYFRSKDRLYFRVLSDMFQEAVESVLSSIPREGSFREFLSAFVSNYVDHLAANPRLIRFVLWEVGKGWQQPEETSVVGTIFRQALERYTGGRNLLLETIRQAVERGEIRPVDPLQLALNLLAVCVYPFVARPLLEGVFPQLDVLSEDFLRVRKREIVDLFWKGLKPPVTHGTLVEEGSE